MIKFNYQNDCLRCLFITKTTGTSEKKIQIRTVRFRGLCEDQVLIHRLPTDQFHQHILARSVLVRLGFASELDIDALGPTATLTCGIAIVKSVISNRSLLASTASLALA